jgi:hypothetical protein
MMTSPSCSSEEVSSCRTAACCAGAISIQSGRPYLWRLPFLPRLLTPIISMLMSLKSLHIRNHMLALIHDNYMFFFRKSITCCCFDQHEWAKITHQKSPLAFYRWRFLLLCDLIVMPHPPQSINNIACCFSSRFAIVCRNQSGLWPNSESFAAKSQHSLIQSPRRAAWGNLHIAWDVDASSCPHMKQEAHTYMPLGAIFAWVSRALWPNFHLHLVYSLPLELNHGRSTFSKRGYLASASSDADSLLILCCKLFTKNAAKGLHKVNTWIKGKTLELQNTFGEAIVISKKLRTAWNAV